MLNAKKTISIKIEMALVYLQTIKLLLNYFLKVK